jgi:hypothetical protein
MLRGLEGKRRRAGSSLKERTGSSLKGKGFDEFRRSPFRSLLSEKCRLEVRSVSRVDLNCF